MEAGGINVDGEGTLLTTEQCVLNDNRNPGFTKEEAEQIFRESLGVEKVLWMRDKTLTHYFRTGRWCRSILATLRSAAAVFTAIRSSNLPRIKTD